MLSKHKKTPHSGKNWKKAGRGEEEPDKMGTKNRFTYSNRVNGRLK